MPRRVSDPTRTLIQALYRPVPFWRGCMPSRQSILQQIKDSKEPAAIFDIVPLLFERNKDVAKAAAETIQSLAANLTPASWPSVDQEMRSRSHYRLPYPPLWVDVRPQDLRNLAELGDSSVFALGMTSFHARGFVREEAVALLAKVGTGPELPFLLLRLNDWVPQVREAAERAVRARLTAAYAAHFVNNVALVLRLRHTREGTNQLLLDAIKALLEGADGVSALGQGFRSSDRSVRRYCFRAASKSTAGRPEAVHEQALGDHDPVIREWATAAIASIADAERASALLARMRVDRFPSARKRALEISVERFAAEARPWVEQALLDPHPAIRGLAQFQADRQYGIPLRDFYVKAVQGRESACLYGALCGIGEVGQAADTGLIGPFACDGDPKLRRAAVRGLARLGAPRFVDVLKESLADAHSRVSREAARGLSKVPHLLEGVPIWQLLQNTSFPHVRRNALFLIAQLTKWESIGYLIEALSSADERVVRNAEMYVQRWYRRFNVTFTQPSDVQKTRIVQALAKGGDRLNWRLREQLEYAVWKA